MSLSKSSKWFIGIIYSLFIFFMAQISPPFFSDLYNYKLKRLLFKAETSATVELHVVSTTSFQALDNYKKNKNYYEITSFKIVNTGKQLDEDAKINIEARGEIIGITPDTLKERLVIQKNDPTHASLKIGKLEPGEQLKGEIHSFARMANDRNKSTIGFDKAGNYKLTIKGD